jgi:hypothetical protein
MKNLSLICLVLALFSCSAKEENADTNILENLSYTVDTVMVDPKGEVIDLTFGIHRSSVSTDARRLYHFDMRKTAINEIDLDRLELVDTYTFSKEGPNAVGFNPPSLKSLSDDRFLITSPMTNIGIYSKDGRKEKSLKFNFKEIEGLGVDEEGLITNGAVLSDDEKTLYALTIPEPTLSEVKLMVIDIESKTGKSILLPEMLQALKYTLLLRMPRQITRIPETISIQNFGERIFVHSSVTSSIYSYDPGRDSLQLIEFPHHLVPKKKTGEFKNNIFSDKKEFDDAVAKQIYQVGFREMIWDEQRRQFFRFAHEPILGEEVMWPKRAKVFLFVYDKDLNLLGEKYLTELEKLPEFAFFKDGKLWSYVNVDDELGFAVMDFKF